MGIEVKITADSTADLHTQIAELLAGTGGEVAAPKAKRGSRKTAEAAEPSADEGNAGTGSGASDSQSSGTGSTQTEAGLSNQDDKPTIEYAQVRSAVMSLAAKKGREAVVEVLATFGVDNATKLQEAQWAAALAELEKAAE